MARDTVDEEIANLTKELKKQAREPFRRALERLLGFRPTEEALRSFSNKYPDKWAQAISILAGLSGYEKGFNITVRHQKPVEQMTDQELIEEQAKIDAQLGITRRVIDIPMLEVKDKVAE
jgi:hypothetical protein